MAKAKLFDAVQHLDIAAVRAILDAKPALRDARDRQDRNVLHQACCIQDADARRLVTFLLERGFDIEATAGKDRCTPLFFAVARARDPRLAAFLIARGASPKNAPGGALFAAAWWEDVKSIDLLVRAGAEVDVVVGVTPFLASWCSRRFIAAKALASHGADVNFRNPRTGKTAWDYGVKKKYDSALMKWLTASMRSG